MPEKEKKPNIIYILADDMGYGDISAFNENCPFITRTWTGCAKEECGSQTPTPLRPYVPLPGMVCSPAGTTGVPC